LDPTNNFLASLLNNDDVTVVALNCSNGLHQSTSPLLPFGSMQLIAAMACSIFSQTSHKYLNAITIVLTHAIADTGAASIFIMDGVNVVNKRITNKPLTINMPDGRKVKSTHICDITIPGLPTVFAGHIIPHLAIASLIGIWLLCNAGCTITFDKDKCDVIYNGNIILQGFKDITTNSWTLPINGLDMQTALPRSAPQFNLALHDTTAQLHPGMNLSSFTHSVKTRTNGVRFAHQLLCNPKISTLLKAVQKGFLKGCPNLSEKLILKYLNPSPATAKGHMKQLRHGIKSTCPKTTTLVTQPLHIMPPPVWTQLPHDFVPPAIPAPNMIGNDCNESIANVFCFGAFANRQTGESFTMT
jgi:hypothetical protein